VVIDLLGGLSIETLAMNAQTTSNTIDGFYGSYVLSALNKGTEIF